MSRGTVSVVIPSYNCESYIKETLQSVENQTYNDIELIVVDDCSTDNSRLVLKECLDSLRSRSVFNSVIYFENPKNSGAHHAINVGLNAASGRYLTILNADDLYEKKRFEIMIEQMHKFGARIAFSCVNFIDSSSCENYSEEANTFRKIQDSIRSDISIGLQCIKQNLAISSGNLVFENSFWKEINEFKNYKYIHDWDFLLRSTLQTEPLFVRETNYLYRLHNANSFRDLGDLADIEVTQVLKSFFSQIGYGNSLNKNIEYSLIEKYLESQAPYMMKYLWYAKKKKTGLINLFKR